MNYLILSAVTEEQHFYRETLQTQQQMRVGHIDVSVCQQDAATLYCATTGMGTVNAAIAVATLATVIKPDAIFFSGTSGGIDPSLAIGDVLIAATAFDADIFTIHDAVAGTAFESALINPHTQTMTPKFYQPAEKLLGLAQSLTHEHCRVTTGIVATSNHFPAPKPLFELIKHNNASIIDMETAAIYQYGWLSNIPCLTIRGVSNCLDANGDDNNECGCDVHLSAENAARCVLACIHI